MTTNGYLTKTEIGTIANGWRITRLAEVCEPPQYGFTASASEKGNVRFLRITDITESGVNWSSVPFCECPTELFDRFRLASGDLVVARIGATTGKSYLINDPPKSAFASYLIRVRPKKEMEPVFLAQFFQSSAYWRQIDAQKQANLKKGISGSLLKTLILPVPPLTEQRKIAGVLGLVQRAIQQQERLLSLTAELKKSLFHQLFTGGLRNEHQKQTELGLIPKSWEVLELGDVFDCLDGRRIPVKESDRKRGPYPYYGASGIVDYVSDYIFDGEYLLVAEDGENLESRKLPIAFIAKGKFWVNNHAHVLKNRSGSLKFFEQFISYMNIRDYLSGTTRPKLNKALMMSILLPVPSEHEQLEIGKILETIDVKISLQRRKQAALGALFRTLLHNLMTAQIRVH